MTRIDAGGLPVTRVCPTPQPAQACACGPFLLSVVPDSPWAPTLACGPAAAAAADRAATAIEQCEARRRLIVLSHGTGGSAHSDHQRAATLERAGLVVAQPLHAGDGAALLLHEPPGVLCPSAN